MHLTKQQKKVQGLVSRPILAVLMAVVLGGSGCVATSAPPPGRRVPQQGSLSRSSRGVDSWEEDRLRRAVAPLIRSMNEPCRLSEVRVDIVHQSEINAANGGSCHFYVTTALLRQANDEQLLGVMAHEIAHQDLGHLARAQVLGTGLNIGALLLEQLFPGSGALTPLAGTLIARGYGRSEEYAADRHAVEILRRAGYSKEVMVGTLNWIRRTSGDKGGGFFSTHPALDDRIAELSRLR